jgi:coproporphyrinogen III oxidase-like Fe-S oxidoreductase
VAPPTSIAAVRPELRQITRDLNLHVPPSYFTTSTSRMPYERALAPLIREDSDPLHLYLGVPLCEEHCRFCMYFYGYADEDGRKAEECLVGLEDLLRAITPDVERKVAGMYIGGGTPTVLSASQIDRLLAAVSSTFEFEATSQRTFEMSPRSFSRDKASAIADHGIRRVSFGVQSFDPEPVRQAGRAYVTPESVSDLIGACRDEGIVEINADLMVGLAGESDTSLCDSVEQLLQMGCPTVSIYRYRPARKVELVDNGGLDAYVTMCARRVQLAIDVADRHGYEVSGRVDGEHVRLSAPGSCPWPEANLYETRYRPHLRNSLVGLGSGARSFLRNDQVVHCEHRAADGFQLEGREVEVEYCDGPSQLAAAIVNGLFRDLRIDLRPLRSLHDPQDWQEVDPAIADLVSMGVLTESEGDLTVDAAHREEWAYWDKYLYPSDWLRRRQLSDRLRVR